MDFKKERDNKEKRLAEITTALQQLEQQRGQLTQEGVEIQGAIKFIDANISEEKE